MSCEYTINRAFFSRKTNGRPKYFIAIIADTKTKQEQDMINQEIDDSLGLISVIVSGANSQEACQEFIDGFCEGIRKDHDIDCYGITSKAFCGIFFGSDCWLVEEEMNYE